MRARVCANVGRFGFAIALCALLPLPASAQSSDAALRLAERIASNGGATAHVYVGRTPPGLPAVPLPTATLLGSVEQAVYITFAEAAPAASDSGQSFRLFYDASNRASAVDTYERGLTSAGWTQANFDVPIPRGGFAPSIPLPTSYCKGAQAISISQSRAEPSAFEIVVGSGGGGVAALACGPHPFLERVQNLIPASPLPTFTAPPGVTIAGSIVPNLGTTTAARVSSTLGLAATFEAFGKQLRDAGWTAHDLASSATSRTQTFSKAGGNQTYEAVLVMYTLAPNSYGAVSDVHTRVPRSTGGAAR